MSAVYRIDAGLGPPRSITVDALLIYPHHIALVQTYGGEWHYHLGAIRELVLEVGTPVRLAALSSRNQDHIEGGS